MTNGKALVEGVKRYMDNDGGDDNDMADITDAQMDKIAEKCAAKVWAKIISYNYTDQSTGKMTAKKEPASTALSAATTWSGQAAWDAEKAKQQTD